MPASIDMVSVPSCVPLTFQPPAFPTRACAAGTWCRLDPLDPAVHGDDLWAAMQADQADASWKYVAHGPFYTRPEMDEKLADLSVRTDAIFFAVRDDDVAGAVRGWASLM